MTQIQERYEDLRYSYNNLELAKDEEKVNKKIAKYRLQNLELKNIIKLYNEYLGTIVETKDTVDVIYSENLRDTFMKKEPKIVEIHRKLEERTSFLLEIGYGLCPCDKIFYHNQHIKSCPEYEKWIEDGGEDLCPKCFHDRMNEDLSEEMELSEIKTEIAEKAFMSGESSETVYAIQDSETAEKAYRKNENAATIQAIAYSEAAAKAYIEKKESNIVEAISYSNASKEAYINGRPDDEILDKFQNVFDELVSNVDSKKTETDKFFKKPLRRSARLASKNK